MKEYLIKYRVNYHDGVSRDIFVSQIVLANNAIQADTICKKTLEEKSLRNAFFELEDIKLIN